MRVIASLVKGRASLQSTRARTILSIVSLALFGAGFAYAFANLPPLHSRPNWALLTLVLAVGVPLSLLWNAAEYILTLRVIGRRAPISRTARISVLAAAANLLPIPGSVLVRGREMYRISGAGRDVVRATATIGMAFLGTAALSTGAFLIAPGPTWLAVGCLLMGTVLLSGSYVLLRGTSRPRSTLVVLVLVEAGSVFTKAFRYYVVLRALRYQPGAQEVFALTLMSVIALATGIFPGGIGGSELLAAAISPLIRLPIAVGVITSAIDNLVQFIGLAIPTALVVSRPSVTDNAESNTVDQQSRPGSEPGSSL